MIYMVCKNKHFLFHLLKDKQTLTFPKTSSHLISSGRKGTSAPAKRTKRQKTDTWAGSINYRPL